MITTFQTRTAKSYPRFVCNMRDLAKPVLNSDSAAKVQLRRKVRGLRTVERQILTEESSEQKKKL